MDRDVEREIDQRRSEVASEQKSASKAVAKAIKHNSGSELDCCDSIKDRISKFLEDKDSFIGTAFVHTIGSTDFYGRVKCMEKDRFVIGYWGLMESESGSVDHSVEVVALFAD